MPVRGACDRPATLELAAGGLPDGALGVRGGVSSPAAEPVIQGRVDAAERLDHPREELPRASVNQFR